MTWKVDIGEFRFQWAQARGVPAFREASMLHAQEVVSHIEGYLGRPVDASTPPVPPWRSGKKRRETAPEHESESKKITT
jgi:hypothetical protein